MRGRNLIITASFEAVLGAMMIFCLFYKGGYEYWTAFFSMVLMAVPYLLQRLGKATLPWPVVLASGVALFLHSLGLTVGFYGLFWWDKITHLMSGIAVASLVALVLLVMMHYTNTIRIPPKWFPFLLLVSVLAFEGLWEALEFSMDTFRGTVMQHGLQDTVNDIVTNTVSGLVAGLGAAYFIGRTSIARIVESMKVEGTVRSLMRHSGR